MASERVKVLLREMEPGVRARVERERAAERVQDAWEQGAPLSMRCAEPMVHLLECDHENASEIQHAGGPGMAWCAGCGAIRGFGGEWTIPVRLERLAKAWCGE